MASYCGSRGPDGVVSAADGHLYLSFTTDSTSTHDGFRLTYRQIVNGTGVFSDVAKTYVVPMLNYCANCIFP